MEGQQQAQHTPYNATRIAFELQCTALGEAYFGNALRVAKDIPGVTPEDRALLDRYATGTQRGIDHIYLQSLSQRIAAGAQA